MKAEAIIVKSTPELIKKLYDSLEDVDQNMNICQHALERFKERYPNISLDEDFYEIAMKGIKKML